MDEYCDLNIRIFPVEQEPGETNQYETRSIKYKVGVSSNTAGEKFAIMLSDEPLRLVFLNACNTGTTARR